MRHSGLRTSGRSIIATFACSAMLAGILIAAATPAGAAQESIALVADIIPGSDSSSPSSLININGTLFFSATTAGAGTELWKSDGTAAGTVLIKDINPGTANSNPSSLFNFNGTLYFTANGPGNGLWKSDGTAAGTVQVGTLSPSVSLSGFTVVGNELLFGATGPTGGVELWKTDGTEAGTVMVKDINTTTVAGGSSTPSGLVNINGTVYFRAQDGVTGVELWKTDGTEAGTVQVKDINPTAGTGSTTNSNPQGFTESNGVIFFSAAEPVNGNELWRTDGTAAGTTLVADVNPGATNSNAGNFIAYNGTLIFSGFNTAGTAPTIGNELWKSDGTAAGTVLVKNIHPTGSSAPQLFTISNNILYFMATEPSLGAELWRTDGTTAGTTLVKDIVPGTGSGLLTNFARIDSNGTLYFTGGGFDREMWKTDGTTAGTVRVYDLVPGTGGSFPSSFVIFNGTIFMQAFTPATGSELYRLNNGPTAVGESYATDEDTPLTITAPGLLANDTDPDAGDALTAVKVTDPAHGSVTVNGDGSFTYTPAANYTGPDSFTYKANDGSADSDPVTVNITVDAAADAPVANDDSYSTNQNASLTITAPGVLGNDSDPDGDTLTAGSASVPAHGAVALNPNGGFTYTPNGGYTGPDSFTYVVSDGLGGTDTGTVNITVTVPTLSASPASVSAGSAVTATWSGVGNPTATDWVGLYDSSSAPDPALLAWSFTGGGAAGNLNLTVPAGATPGTTYELRLYANNTYTRIATSAPFEVTAPAVSATTISASPSSVPAGGTVTATWADIASPTATDWVGLYDSSSASDSALLAWAYTGGTAGGSLPLTVPSGATPGSAYELRLFSNNTYTRLATSAPFAVTASATTLSATPATVNAGGVVTATWSGIASPTATDWVGLYASSSAADPALLAWSYTDGNASGGLNLTVPVGAASGTTYELRLYSNNTYTRLATSNSFEVVASGATVSGSSPVAAGAQLTATWSNIGNPRATDWIGLYANSTDPDTAIVGESTVDGVTNAWAYTGGATSGSLNLTVPASAPPGTTYELRLYSNNSYTRLATSAPITVT